MADTLYILGAGFSHNAGLPLQREFTDAILEGRTFSQSGPSKVLTEFLSAFVADVFGHTGTDRWPDLEDLFTCVDLAANTGHQLGQYSPGDLRTVRRALISRIIRMLRQRYRVAKAKSDLLSDLLREIDYDASAFVVLNWDTVLEDRLSELKPTIEITHGAGIEMVGPDGDPRPQTVLGKPSNSVKIVKMHGSINWLYCDSCRRTFAFPPNRSSQIAAQLLGPEDWDRIDRILVEHGLRVDPVRSRKRTPLLCKRCRGVPLGTRLATFSYRKALDFPMFQHSWYSAEKLLRSSKRWVLIGYSLPAADFEFKHLLKRIEISRKTHPKIMIVTGGSAASATRTNYRQFFGSTVAQVVSIEEARERI